MDAFGADVMSTTEFTNGWLTNRQGRLATVLGR
jgi:hypothetical protein